MPKRRKTPLKTLEKRLHKLQSTIRRRKKGSRKGRHK